jgi:hypothetical protein
VEDVPTVEVRTAVPTTAVSKCPRYKPIFRSSFMGDILAKGEQRAAKSKPTAA